MEITSHVLSPSLALWQAYDPSVKADLFSTALATAMGVYLIDPVPFPTGTLADWFGTRRVVGIIVTNANHERAAVEFADQFQVPIHARPEVFANSADLQIHHLAAADHITPDLAVIAIDGAPPGEIALHFAAEDGALIMGDALINMGSPGFDFLPAKYCRNVRLMRKSLRQLLDYPCARILFAHGTPIITHAQRRLAHLLGGDTASQE